MAARAERAGPAPESGEIERVAALLGGARVLRQRLRGPIDLLATPAGAKLVEQLLVRIQYGVYT